MGRASLVGMAVGMLLASAPAFAQAPAQRVSGRVVDTRDGAPIANVSVRLQATGAQVMTDDDGRFAFDAVVPGDHELFVSAVDFILVRRAVHVDAAAPVEITIALAEGAGTYTESVTVRSATPVRRDAAVAASQVLAGRELQSLRGVLANDPLRAVQMLPAVAAGDDFRSEFAIRGAGLDHMAFTFEGVATPFLLHTVQQVRDSGSVAMVNGDVLDEIAVANGAYAQRHGNRTGAEIDFRLREGSRDRVQKRAAASAIDASAVFEGPIGSERRGSWLATARKSYLDLVADRLYPDQGISFGFADAQAKLVYDVTAHHQLQVAATAGRSRLERTPAVLGPGNLRDADNRSVLAVATWRFVPSARTIVEQRAAIADNAFTNVSRDGAELDGGDGTDLVYRVDATHQASDRVTVETGGELRRTSGAAREQRFGGRAFLLREDFTGAAVTASTYIQTRLGRAEGWSVTPGVRVDRRSLTGTASASPWIQLLWPLSPTITLRAGSGIYRQEPGLAQVLGMRGDRTLGLERAVHADAGLEGRVSRAIRWQMTVYDREDRDLVRVLGTEPRVVDNRFAGVSFASRYANALQGHARGIELLVQRQAANGFSGWASYALGFNRYHDALTGESFWGDYDQRHTVNVYGSYRVNDRLSVSARLRAGSNFPTAGYWTERDGTYYLSDARNTLRIPRYSRVDVRLDRTFAWQQKRLTLFLEGINVLNQRNVRVELPSVDWRTFQATGLFETMVPILPSVGVVVEF